MKGYLIVIEGDTNDGDYISNTSFLSEKEYSKVENTINKVADTIRGSTKRHNWGNEYSDDEDQPEEQYVKTGKITEKELEKFQEYIPHGEYGVHTIQSIAVYTIEDFKELL